MKARFVRLALFLAALLSSASVAKAQEDVATVTVEGFEAIIGDNQQIARDKAIEQALRSAVEQVAGTIVSSQTLVENFQLVNDSIYAKSRGFVKSHKVLSEGAPGDGTYKVTVQVTVAKAMLQESLKDLVEGTMQVTNKPRTLFMIAEQQYGDTVYHAWWTYLEGVKMGGHAESFDLNTVENSFLEIFTNNSFPVVDIATASKNIKVSNAFGVVDLTDKAVRDLGNQMAAEMVIYGKAFTKKGQQILNSPMYSYSANISIKVVNTDTGRVVTSAAESVTIPHSIPEVGTTEAMKQCAKKVADLIMPKMITTIAQNKSVELQVTYGRYNDLAKFKQALKEDIRSVQAIHQRAAAKGSTTLELDLKTGTAQSIADEIAVREFKEFLVEVEEVTQNTIKISLVKK
ncbi:MAG: flagellar assembly protein T N-terminal domain-containing protein [Bdellovibrionota bacterium]